MIVHPAFIEELEKPRDWQDPVNTGEAAAYEIAQTIQTWQDGRRQFLTLWMFAPFDWGRCWRWIRPANLVKMQLLPVAGFFMILGYWPWGYRWNRRGIGTLAIQSIRLLSPRCWLRKYSDYAAADAWARVQVLVWVSLSYISSHDLEEITMVWRSTTNCPSSRTNRTVNPDKLVDDKVTPLAHKVRENWNNLITQEHQGNRDSRASCSRWRTTRKTKSSFFVTPDRKTVAITGFAIIPREMLSDWSKATMASSY